MSKAFTGNLFVKPAPMIAPTDPNVMHSDVKRLTGQNAAILDRLKKGPATNSELSGIALKYTSRLSDVRAAGFNIIGIPREGGVWVYHLAGGAK